MREPLQYTLHLQCLVICVLAAAAAIRLLTYNVMSHNCLISPSFSLLRTNLVQRSALPLLPTAFPWGEAVNHLAARAAITVPSASVGSSELSVTAEWATLIAAKGRGLSSSEMTHPSFM